MIRDWVLRFNAEGPGGLIDRKAPGQPPKLDDAQRQALAQLVENGPIPAAHGVVRWRLKDCASHLSHPGCIKNADRSAGTGDGTIFAVRRA